MPRKKFDQPMRFVRVSLNEEDFALLSRGAKIDRRSNQDFLRACALRYAGQLCVVEDSQNVYNQIKQALPPGVDVRTLVSPELPFKDDKDVK